VLAFHAPRHERVPGRNTFLLDRDRRRNLSRATHFEELLVTGPGHGASIFPVRSPRNLTGPPSKHISSTPTPCPPCYAPASDGQLLTVSAST